MKKVADVFGPGPKETRCVESLFYVFMLLFYIDI